MRRIATVLGAAALALYCLASGAGATAQRVVTGGTTDNIWVLCLYSGVSATVDPIVDPGSTTTAHFHDFFGNLSTDQNSTPDSLRATGVGNTSCTLSTDTAGYWAPTLVLGPGETQTYPPANGPCTTDAAGLQACHYNNLRAYYSTSGAPKASMVVPPQGEEVVGGDHTATGPQPLNHIGWACGASTPFEPYPYDCTGHINTTGNNDQDGVTMRIIMPRCWDGVAAMPADFAYPTTGTGAACPAGFPKVLPLINIRFHTGIVNPCLGELNALGQQVACPQGSSVTPNFGFELADGTMMPWYQAHADFMNGWQYAPQDNPGGLDDLITDCLKLSLHCLVNPHTSPASNMTT